MTVAQNQLLPENIDAVCKQIFQNRHDLQPTGISGLKYIRSCTLDNKQFFN